jgi:hypothetical protein
MPITALWRRRCTCGQFENLHKFFFLKILKILITSTFFLRLDLFQVNFAGSSDGINQNKTTQNKPCEQFQLLSTFKTYKTRASVTSSLLFFFL